MATSIPPPPFLGPLTGVAVTGAYPDWVNLFLLRWDENQQNWVTLNWGQHPWDSFPAGYYATAHLDEDGNVDWGPHSTVIVVAGRSRPDGTAADFVLEQPPAAAIPDSRCPPNMWFTDLPDQFNVIPGALLCSWLVAPPQQVCPPGTYWDSATETCKAIVLPLPVFPPSTPPPPPPPETGQPNPQGDEITYELCLQMKANADAIIFAINQLQGAIGGDPAGAAACCANVVTAINLVSKSLLQIFGLLNAQAAKPAPPITFAPAITIEVPPQPPPTVTVNEAPFDQANLERIAKSNETIAQQGDVQQAILNQLFQSGVLPKSMSNLLQGSAWSDAVTGLHAWQKKVANATWWQDISYGIRLIAHLNAGDPGGPPPPSLDDPPLGGPDASAALAAGTKVLLEWGFKHFDEIASPFVKGILEAHAGEMRAMRDVKPGEEIETATRLMTEASTFGVGAHFAAVLGEMIYPSKTLGFPQLAATLALFSGYDELIKGYIGSEVRAVITTPHTYATNARARSYLPAANAALTLSARRKLLDADLNALLDFNGISPTYRAALNAGKYRPISPRALATLTLDQPFDRAQMQEILEDNSMSPDHVQFMLTQLEYNSTKNVRAQYISEAETAYKQGVMSDQEFAQILGDIGWSSAAIQLVKSKVLLQRRITLASEVEKQVTTFVAAGLETPDDGFRALEAAGVQDWYAQLVVTLAADKAAVQQARIDASNARREELARERNLTRAAVAEFQRGVIDEAGLTVALAAIPLDPTLVASVVAVQDATRTGRLRLVFGQLLLPEEAKVLADRVAAIEGQFKKQLITFDQARSQLQGLNVDGPELDALLARWAAALTAASKYAYLVDPLTGQKV